MLNGFVCDTHGNNGAGSGNKRDMAVALLDKETLLCKLEFIGIGFI